jgi:hypothetical protein
MTTFELPRRIDSGAADALSRLGAEQDGVARRGQLGTAGISRYEVDSMIAGGRWRPTGAVVVVLHNGPLTRHQQLWSAVLNAGADAALAARTAVTEQGLVGWDAACIEILVPRGLCVPSGLGLDVKVHESRRFTSADLHPGRRLPQVTMERGLIDGAAWSTSPRTACGLLAAGVQQRLTTVARLRHELELAGKIRHRRLLTAALTDIEGGAQSMSEVDFVRFCQRNGMPRPVMQTVRVDGRGRRRYLDATFERRDGRRVRVEIDGALHLVVRTYWDDMSRGNELTIGRETVLRFPSYVIYANDQTAIDQLRRALGLSGSAGPRPAESLTRDHVGHDGT